MAPLTPEYNLFIQHIIQQEEKRLSLAFCFSTVYMFVHVRPYLWEELGRALGGFTLLGHIKLLQCAPFPPGRRRRVRVLE
jgi:hypothetical protein